VAKIWEIKDNKDRKRSKTQKKKTEIIVKNLTMNRYFDGIIKNLQ
jgi:hypothetical protein